MAFRTVANLNFGAQDFAGNCLPMAQKVAGAGGGPVSATQAANATKFQHHDRNFPSDAVAVVWFSHKGTYTNYITGRDEFGDWGHVVMRDPNHFGPGVAGYYSSPRNGYGGEWFRSVEEIEAAFNSSYRFWSEDINGVRVSAPTGGTSTGAAVTPREDGDMQSIVVNGNQYGIVWQGITHYGDARQAEKTRQITSASDELHNLTVKGKPAETIANLNAVLDGHGIPRSVLDANGRVLNPQTGKYEANGTWSREREILAKLGAK